MSAGVFYITVFINALLWSGSSMQIKEMDSASEYIQYIISFIISLLPKTSDICVFSVNKKCSSLC